MWLHDLTLTFCIPFLASRPSLQTLSLYNQDICDAVLQTTATNVKHKKRHSALLGEIILDITLFSTFAKGN